MSRNRGKLTRRTFLVGGGLAGCCVLGVGGAFGINLARTMTGHNTTSNIGDLAFDNPLAIPPLAESTTDDEGRTVWDLTLQAGETDIVPDGTTKTWGVNGTFLAPTLRAKRGETVAPVLRNDLPEDTTIHWHGMHLPARMDGGPHQMIPMGETWNPTWTIDQPASTLWYHPHPHGKTAEHVYRGISGLFLIDDETLDGLHVPNEYGVDDVPLIIQDKRFSDNGDLSLEPASFIDSLSGMGSFGILGDTILVNGTYDPHFEVTRSLTRFRILNGSNARFYNFGFDDDRSFRVIATDNGFGPGEPRETNRILVEPAERVEIVVEFQPGDDVILRSYEHERINGEKMDMNRIDEVVPVSALEIWNVTSDVQPHTFHMHGSTFHVLEVDGFAPPLLNGPKDTVLVSPDHGVKLAVQFARYTDPDFPYMYHCHILRHEDNGMMGQFVVVEPGTEDTVSRTLNSGHHH